MLEPGRPANYQIGTSFEGSGLTVKSREGFAMHCLYYSDYVYIDQYVQYM